MASISFSLGLIDKQTYCSIAIETGHDGCCTCELENGNGTVARPPPRTAVPKGEAAVEAISAAVSYFSSPKYLRLT
jgi:hypothetical protein